MHLARITNTFCCKHKKWPRRDFWGKSITIFQFLTKYTFQGMFLFIRPLILYILFKKFRNFV